MTSRIISLPFFVLSLALLLAPNSHAHEARHSQLLLKEKGIEPTAAEALKHLESLVPREVRAERVQKLIKQLGNDVFGMREAAQRELLAMGASVKEAVQQAITSDDAEVRQRAAAILRQLETEADDAVVYAAFDVVRQSTPEDVVPRVIGVLPLCTTDRLQRIAGDVLLEITTADHAKALAAAVNDDSVPARATAMRAFAKINGDEASETLKRHLDDDALEVRLAAAWALANKGDRRALATLIDLLASDSFEIRRSALLVLVPLTQQFHDFDVHGDAKENEASLAKWRAWLDEVAKEAELKFPVKNLLPGVEMREAVYRLRYGEEDELNPFADFADGIRTVARDTSELPVGLKKADVNWTTVGLNLYGNHFEAFRFRVPEGDKRDMVWAFFPLPQDGFEWYILPMTAENKGGFRNFHRAEKDKEIFVLQHLEADKLVPGEEYILWFIVKSEKPVVLNLSVNMRPAGKVENDGAAIGKVISGQ